MKLLSDSRFRANEEAASGREEAIRLFSCNFKQTIEREAAAAYMATLIDTYGPVVEGYPFWHPFITEGPARSFGGWPDSRPQGFDGLDHTIYFRDAFVTAPYGNADSVGQSSPLAYYAREAHTLASLLARRRNLPCTQSPLGRPARKRK
jgi:hypothetical protein